MIELWYSNEYLSTYFGSHMETIGTRLKEERNRLGLSQTKFADIGGVKKGAQIKYESDARNPDAAYWANVTRAGVDIQFVFTGQRSSNPPVFGEKVEEFRVITERLEALAGRQNPRPDPYLVITPLRDLVWSARLSDQQIQVIFDLLNAARAPSFWLGIETPKTSVTQTIHGNPINSQISSGDMTVHNVNSGSDDKKK